MLRLPQLNLPLHFPNTGAHNSYSSTNDPDSPLSLPLLMLGGSFADHVHLPLALNYLAITTDRFNGSSYFHRYFSHLKLSIFARSLLGIPTTPRHYLKTQPQYTGPIHSPTAQAFIPPHRYQWPDTDPLTPRWPRYSPSAPATHRPGWPPFGYYGAAPLSSTFKIYLQPAPSRDTVKRYFKAKLTCGTNKAR